MLNSMSHLTGAKLTAIDGDIGKVAEFFFDDRAWTIRYLVVETGSWLADRKVLISPYAVKQPIGRDKHIHTVLTQQQVKKSPDVDTHQPVSRQHERDYLDYYDYPEYWGGSALWGMEAMPYPPMMRPAAEIAAARALRTRDFKAADVHLRSSAHVIGYDIQATDESIGHVQDFIFDDQNWAIRYLVVDTRNWLPGGRKVLIGMHWADRIDWATQKVHVRLTREQVMSSPLFEDVSSIHRDYEMRLHQNYQREGYWL